ncbi:hypothetical protein TNCV_1195531 [Trichonephila clavipes]|nr:hypothetical protein TNCV_1195531 [Trichonephila clavipes]
MTSLLEKNVAKFRHRYNCIETSEEMDFSIGYVSLHLAKFSDLKKLVDYITLADPAWEINLEVDSDDVQQMLDSHNHKLTIGELIQMHEQDHDIVKLVFRPKIRLEDRMTFGNFTKTLSLDEKRVTNSMKYRLQRSVYFFSKTSSEKLFSMLRGNFTGEKNL